LMKRANRWLLWNSIRNHRAETLLGAAHIGG